MPRRGRSEGYREKRGDLFPVTLLGYRAEILIGKSVIRGTLVDETARTLTVRTDGGELRRLPKDQIVSLSLQVKEGVWLRTEGRKLLGMPAERLKRSMRYGWTRPG
ncbi:MAG: hypothetical protein QXP43_02810 [Nitrososphaerota archaeon]